MTQVKIRNVDPENNPLEAIESVESQAQQNTDIFEEYNRNRGLNIQSNLNDFVDKTRRGQEGVDALTRLPNYSELSPQQKLQLDQLKKEKGLDFAGDSTPGSIIEAMKAKQRYDLAQAFKPSYLPNFDAPKDYYQQLDVNNVGGYLPVNRSTPTSDPGVASNMYTNNIGVFDPETGSVLFEPGANQEAGGSAGSSINSFFDQYQGTAVGFKDTPTSAEYIGQCVSLVKKFYQEQFGVTIGAMAGNADSPGGEGGAYNGYAFFGGKGPDGYSAFDDTQFSDVQKNYQVGDVVFWEPGQGADPTYGHIAIVASAPDENGNFTVLEQSPDGQGTRMDRQVNVDITAGGLRYNGYGGAATEVSGDPTSVSGYDPSLTFEPGADTNESIIIKTAQSLGVTDPNQLAYILATAKHESDNFNTLEEYASGAAYEGRADLGNTQAGDGTRYKGRGYVQLTGRTNYQKYTDKLGIDLINNPEILSTNPYISAYVLVDGMINGAFTGVGLGNYINDSSTDFNQARRVVNGLDRSNDIANIAQTYRNQLIS